MAVILTDGFDMYNGTSANTGLATKWLGDLPGLAAGRFGGQCLSKNNSASYTTRLLPSSYSGVGAGFAYRATVIRAGNIFAFYNTATIHVVLALNALGGLTVSNGSGTLLGTSAPAIISTNVWHYIEFGVDISDTVGTVKVKVDGVSIFNLSGVDTRNGATTDVNIIGISGIGGSVVSDDDLYVVDSSTTLGERKIETLRTSADTATKNWTPNSGVINYDRVDETLVDGDTTYVQASVVGTRDLYAIGALSSTPATIDAINIISFAQKTDATSRSIYNSIQSNSVDDDGAMIALAASYNKFERILATDPSGGGAWTPTRVNALLIGPKVAA